MFSGNLFKSLPFAILCSLIFRRSFNNCSWKASVKYPSFSLLYVINYNSLYLLSSESAQTLCNCCVSPQVIWTLSSQPRRIQLYYRTQQVSGASNSHYSNFSTLPFQPALKRKYRFSYVCCMLLIFRNAGKNHSVWFLQPTKKGKKTGNIAYILALMPPAKIGDCRRAACHACHAPADSPLRILFLPAPCGG